MKRMPGKIFIKYFFFLVAGLWLTSECKAQSPDLKFEHLNTENGLAQNTITGIVKDKFGFMWFGTWSGLCHYDGYRFKIYRYEQGNTKSIINNKILNVAKDSHQNLWVTTFNYTVLCKYNYDKDNFDRIPIKNVSKGFAKQISRNYHLNHAAVSYKGYQWDIGWQHKDLIQTDLATGKVKNFSLKPENRWSLNDLFVTDLYLDDEHILWVGTYSNGINKANLDGNPFRHIDPNRIIDNNVHAIAEDKQGNIWIGTRDKGITVILRNHTYQHFQEAKEGLSSNFIKTIFCDSRGYVWIGTLRGLDGFDPATKKLRHYKGSGLKNAHVFGITEDYLHQIWFASWNGIYKYTYGTDSLIRQNTAAMPNNSAMAIMEDDKHQIWVGTKRSGVYVFKPSGLDKLQLVDVFNRQGTISDTRVYSVCQDKEKNIWIGTGNGVDRFDPGNRTFKHFIVSPNGLANGDITDIVEDNSGSIWVSHTKGVSQINKHNFIIRNFSTQDGLQGNDFSDGGIFKSSSSNLLYLGGNKGYNTFCPDSIKSDRNAPKVVLTELQILNKPVQINDTVNGRVILHKPLYMTSAISLHYEDKSMAIEFAGLHYANPMGNKYAYMLDGFDKNWIYTDATNRIATYSNLARGTYLFKVKAANSDGIWSPVAATLQITVSPPWWASTFAYIIYIFAFIGLLYLFYFYIIRYDRLKNKLTYENLLHAKELELRQSKIEFFTNISHEIKTPLSLILAPIERLISEGGNHPHIAAKQLQTIKSSGDRLSKLVNQLLDIRRLETGNDKLNLQEDDIVGFVKRTVDSFMLLALDKHVKLNFETSLATLITQFDPDKIEKVLNNLLSNAFKFVPHKGEIYIELQHVQQEGKDKVKISVIDNGIGIPPDELETIFKPFEQASTNKTGGTGLGLAYVKALVELHGGTIHAENTIGHDKQKLTSFIVTIPVVLNHFQVSSEPILLDDVTITDEQPLTEVKKINGKMASLLIVEDDLDLRKYLSEYFRTTYHVLEAANGKGGFKLATDHTPDIIISDMMMPEMNGLELCKKLKSEIMTSHIPVILLTARTPVEFQIEGIEMGADDYMTKPFNLQLLSAKVKNLLAIRVKLQEKYKNVINIQSSEIFPESPDDKLIKKVTEFIEKNISEPELDVTNIGKAIGISRAQLYRKMKALTGLTVSEIIREIRMQHAQRLLAEKKFNINEICYLVGYTEPNYFRKCFKAQFGMSPTDYTRKIE